MLIGTAYAQAAGGAAQESSLLVSLAPMILIFVVFWFLLIRPQQKKMKEHRAMLDALQTGEEVATAGGIIGRIGKIEESMITLQIAEGIDVLIQRGTISQLLPKGTIKTF